MTLDPRLVTPDIRLVTYTALKKGTFVKAVQMRSIPPGAAGPSLWSNYGLTTCGAGDPVYGVVRQDAQPGDYPDVARNGDGAPLILADGSTHIGAYLKPDSNGQGTAATLGTDNVGCRVTFSGQMRDGFIGVTVTPILSTDS